MFRPALWVLLTALAHPLAAWAAPAPMAPNGEVLTLYVTLYSVVPPFEAPEYCAALTSDEQVTAIAGDHLNLCFLVRNQTSVVLTHHEFRRDGVLIHTIDHPVQPGGMEIVVEERVVATGDQDVIYTSTSYEATGGVPHTASARVRLTTLKPQVSLSQPAFDVQAIAGSVAHASLTITNSGQGSLVWRFGESDSASSTNAASATGQTAPAAAGGTTAILPAYAIEQAGAQQNYLLFDLDDPLVSVPIPAQLADIHAGAFVGNDFSRQFLLGSSSGLLTVDTTTGQTTVINAATSPVPGEDGWKGLAWDPVKQRLYGLSSTSEAATIYRIDPATGTTLRGGAVNVFRRALRGIYGAIAVDADGRIYAIDTSNDLLVQVMLDPYSDPGHVSGYTIGPLGFDVEDVAGLTVDTADNGLYLSALDAGSGVGGMYRIDPASGAATQVEALATGVTRIAMSAVTAARPCNNESDVTWLSLSPYTSTPLGAGASEDIDLVLDARHLAEGVYETFACVHSNDLQRNKIPVPVRLTVSPATPADRIFANGFDEGS